MYCNYINLFLSEWLLCVAAATAITVRSLFPGQKQIEGTGPETSECNGLGRSSLRIEENQYRSRKCRAKEGSSPMTAFCFI